MKKTIELNYGNSITINRGNYENEKPMWHQKVTFEMNGETLEQMQAIEEAEFTRLKTAIDKRANDAWERSKLDLSGLRIRVKDGKRYVSATSILNHDKDTSKIDPEYSIRGKEIHRIVNQAILKKKWETPKEPLSKIKYEDIKYKEFFVTHKKRINVDEAKLEVEVFNETHLYSGEIDLICLVDEVPTIVDLKTGTWDWKQLIAYWKCRTDCPQVAIFDLKMGKLEVLDPLTPQANEYWEKFLIKRGEVKARFGI